MAVVMTSLAVLVILCVGLQWIAAHTKTQLTGALNSDFRKFQKVFFVPYLLALFSDWLQGPYVYRLYSQYGYAPEQIALLYICGFGSSVLFGTFTGPLADRFGRKRICLIFCFLYIACCVAKISPNFWWLFAGRVFGGISTSILFSTFEAWYVCQHTEHLVFPSDWISSTFSISTFWNGVLAILSGIAADVAAEWLDYGPVAPFMIAIPFLMLSGVFISLTWTENYGSRSVSLQSSFLQGLRVIFNDPIILLLGLVQSMFESIMYIFIFLWTPVLDSAGQWPLGLVFSCFMVCIMIGSSINTLLLNRNYCPSTILLITLLCSVVSMITCSLSTGVAFFSPFASFVAFLLYEISVGMYFPAMGYLRSQVIPESLRANIMNWFRVPLNIITCAVLYGLHRNSRADDNQATSRGDQNAFFFNIILSIVGTLAAHSFNKKYIAKATLDDSESCKLEN